MNDIINATQDERKILSRVVWCNLHVVFAGHQFDYKLVVDGCNQIVYFPRSVLL